MLQFHYPQQMLWDEPRIFWGEPPFPAGFSSENRRGRPLFLGRLRNIETQAWELPVSLTASMSAATGAARSALPAVNSLGRPPPD
jgi:hypothetical protein